MSHAKISPRSRETLSFAKVETRQRSESAMVTLAQEAKKFKITFGGKDLTSVKSPRTVPLGWYGVKESATTIEASAHQIPRKRIRSLGVNEQ